jgi:hypothetical protein
LFGTEARRVGVSVCGRKAAPALSFARKGPLDFRFCRNETAAPIKSIRYREIDDAFKRKKAPEPLKREMKRKPKGSKRKSIFPLARRFSVNGRAVRGIDRPDATPLAPSVSKLQMNSSRIPAPEVRHAPDQ